MEKLDIKDNGLHVYDVPERYQYVINRGTFELSKAASNIAFMLDKHLDDPDWLDSELYKQLEQRLFETSINNWVYTNGALLAMGIDPAQNAWKISRDYTEIAVQRR